MKAAFLSGWIYSRTLQGKYQGDTSVAPTNVNDYSDGDMVIIGKDFPDITCYYCKTIDEMRGSLVMWALVYSLDASGELQIYIVFRGTQTVFDAVIDISAVPIKVPFTASDDGETLDLHSGIYLAMRSEFNNIINELNKLLASSTVNGKWRTLKLYATGHSLGGGYAQAFGIEMVLNKSRILLDGRSIKEVSAEEMNVQVNSIITNNSGSSETDDQLTSIGDSGILFTVISFASPLMKWIKMQESQINSLQQLNPLPKKKVSPAKSKTFCGSVMNWFGSKAQKLVDTKDTLFPPSNVRDDCRYYVTEEILNDISPYKSYITNVVHLKDVIPRAQYGVKGRWTRQNGLEYDLSLNLTSFLLGGIEGIIPDQIVGYRPLGKSYVIKAKLDGKKYRLRLEDCSQYNDWYMIEYNKISEPKKFNTYTLTPGYQEDSCDGWLAQDHSVKFYHDHLKASLDGQPLTLDKY